MKAIEFQNVEKKFGNRSLFDNLTFDVKDGEFVSLVGESGSGKTTILNIIGLFEEYDKGKVKLFNQEIPKPNSRQATFIRRGLINYLFQSFALITHLTVRQNLLFSLKFTKLSETEKLKQITKVLNELNVRDFENSVINTLSGGEQQRIALARAIIKPGNIILADEPTGSLDPYNSKRVFELLKILQKEHGKTILMVTHNLEQAMQTDRVITLGN